MYGFCQPFWIVFMKLFLGEKLKKLRGKESQKSIAIIMGVSQQCWQAWESNTNELSATIIHGICTQFNCSADWLLGLSSETLKPQTTSTSNSTDRITDLKERIAEQSKIIADQTEIIKSMTSAKKETTTKPLSRSITHHVTH